jgi:hypothetical protein
MVTTTITQVAKRNLVVRQTSPTTSHFRPQAQIEINGVCSFRAGAADAVKVVSATIHNNCTPQNARARVMG